MTGSCVSYLWKDAQAPRGFVSGVSLHSHTSRSKETLDFLVQLANEYGCIRELLAWEKRRAGRMHGLEIDYAAGYWRPPLSPRLAFDLESRQIADLLQLQPLVSITDHDNIQAPMLLRTVESARHIPVSVEWTTPFGEDQPFHLGIHNLPSASGAEWMRRFAEFTAYPSDGQLTEMLAALHDLPNVLIVFNHPLWDLYKIGRARHAQRTQEFLTQNGRFIHAFELNGLRSWEENRLVKVLAARWDKLLISGGDRHGLEPNANVNLTHAASFNEFVHEIRREGRSHVLFMPQYAEPWRHRIFQSTLDAIRDYPDFPEGSQRWDERVFHPDASGLERPIRQLWPKGHSLVLLRVAVGCCRMLGAKAVSRGLRLAWNERRELRFALGESETM
ncbi:MAG TPA: hypothetical protein VGR96_07440 [Acidobacteriaceae bacterium]|nr:hypothetical protein [Acidobacteriaceae bacterium]